MRGLKLPRYSGFAFILAPGPPRIRQLHLRSAANFKVLLPIFAGFFSVFPICLFRLGDVRLAPRLRLLKLLREVLQLSRHNSLLLPHFSTSTRIYQKRVLFPSILELRRARDPVHHAKLSRFRSPRFSRRANNARQFRLHETIMRIHGLSYFARACMLC